jgi:hypothetical protein
MRRRSFLSVFGIAVVIVSFSCKKSETEQPLQIPAEAVHIKVEDTDAAPQRQLLFTLDGEAKDWSGIEPFWAEGGMEGQGPIKSHIEIKQVYFKNDAQYLYVFMRISPTIEERFKTSPTGGIIGNLFLDLDNNAKTGANAAEGRESELYKGYEIRVYIPVGVYTISGKSIPTVGYEVYTHEGGFYGINVVDRQDSMDKGSLIAHGPDGIEFAIKLKALKLTAPANVRVTLADLAHFDEDKGHSTGQLKLEAAK